MEFGQDYSWDAVPRFPLSDRFATASAASTAIATRLHGRVVKRVPFHHHRRRVAACVCEVREWESGEGEGSKTKTNTAEEENMKEGRER